MSAADWSGLHTDILHEIVQHLTPLDFVRFSAVCWSWNSFFLNHRRHCHCLNKFQIPWLELPSSSSSSSSCPADSQTEPHHHRCFYSLTEQKTYKFHLPEIADQRVIGSSSSSTAGFLISLGDMTADLHIINPLTRVCIPLPPTSTFSDIIGVNLDLSSCIITSYILGPSKFGDILAVKRDPYGQVVGYIGGKAPSDFTRTVDLDNMRHTYFKKAIIIPSPSSQQTTNVCMVVVIYKDRELLAFARPGDASWTDLHCPVDQNFEDIIFHKGRLYALSNDRLNLFDLSHPLDGPIVLQNVPMLQDECEALERCLVESPDGDNVFLVFWKFGIYETIGFIVFKFDENRGQWDKVRSLDDLALFVGSNSSMAVSATRHPGLTRNCIYFPDNFESVGGIKVFNLGDGSIKQLNLSISLQKLNWPLPVWFMPSLF